MNRIWRTLLALVVIAPASVSALADATTRPATQPNAGRPNATQARIQKKTYDFKAGDIAEKIEYALFVPSTYDKSKPTPLVVALHGLYSNPQQIMRYPGLTDLAEQYGYIVVAPMGFNNHGWYGAIPLFGMTKADPKNLAELSEKDVLNVMEIVRKEYKVDSKRIYLMGHSMGGGGCWELAIKHPDLFAAIAPIAPATLRFATDVEKIKHLPVILVQGERDVLVRVGNVRPWAEQMKKLGMKHEYIEVAGGDHIKPAFTELPKIFAFLDKQAKR